LRFVAGLRASRESPPVIRVDLDASLEKDPTYSLKPEEPSSLVDSEAGVMSRSRLEGRFVRWSPFHPGKLLLLLGGHWA